MVGLNAIVNSISKMLSDAESMTETLKSVMGSVENGAKSIDLSTHELFRESSSLTDGARVQNQIVADMSKQLDNIRYNSVENVTNASHASEVSRTAKAERGIVWVM